MVFATALTIPPTNGRAANFAITSGVLLLVWGVTVESAGTRKSKASEQSAFSSTGGHHSVISQPNRSGILPTTTSPPTTWKATFHTAYPENVRASRNGASKPGRGKGREATKHADEDELAPVERERDPVDRQKASQESNHQAAGQIRRSRCPPETES